MASAKAENEASWYIGMLTRQVDKLTTEAKKGSFSIVSAKVFDAGVKGMLLVYYANNNSAAKLKCLSQVGNLLMRVIQML